MKLIHYRIEVLLLEDLHSGSGLGGEGLDALQAVDKDGRPSIPWSHFKGLLREQAETRLELGERFGAADESAAQSVIAQLFGASGTQRGCLGGCSLRADGNDEWSLTWSASARRTGSRAPADDTLRHEQFVKADTRFFGELQLVCADDTLAQALELLLDACHQLGGNRSRGAGLIRLQYERSSRDLPAEPPVAGATPAPAPIHNYRLSLRNLDALNLPVTGEPGNIIPTECYVRGQTLLGALARSALSLGWRKLAGALIDGQIAVGNAYPLPPSPDPANLAACEVMPMPLSLYSPKPGGQKGVRPWWSTGRSDVAVLERVAAGRGNSIDKLIEKEKSTDEKRPADAAFIFRADAAQPWVRYEPARRVRLRIQVPDTENKHQAGLFSQEEIVEDTAFLTEVLVPPGLAAAFETLLQTLQGGGAQAAPWLALGRGGRPVVLGAYVLQPRAAVPANGPASSMRLVLESDCIARGPRLGFRTGLDADVLRELIAAVGKTVGKAFKVVESKSDTVEVRGFNVATGLPRAPAIALRRGSSFLIEDGPNDQGAITDLRRVLAELYLAGTALGERASEGCGRFRLDFDPLADNDAATQIATLGGAVIQRATASAELGEELAARALKLLADHKPVVTNQKLGVAQWQALRDARFGSDPSEAVKDQFDRMKKKDGKAEALLNKLEHALKEELARLATLQDGFDHCRAFLELFGRGAALRAKAARDKQATRSV